MRLYRVIVLLVSCLPLGIATAEGQQTATGGRALRGLSSDHHHSQHRAAQEVDKRCQIPTTDKPDCVDNQEDLLMQISDITAELILICQGATIILEKENVASSIPINSDKAIICVGSSNGDCIIDGLDISGNQEPAFKIGQLAVDIHVSICGMSFTNFGIVSATVMLAREHAALVNHRDVNSIPASNDRLQSNT
jgi:hypothetical protein